MTPKACDGHQFAAHLHEVTSNDQYLIDFEQKFSSLKFKKSNLYYIDASSNGARFPSNLVEIAHINKKIVNQSYAFYKKM